MALIRDLSKAQIAFQVDGGDVDLFKVLRYCGTEGLCQLYRFEIELAVSDETVNFDDVVGKPAVLSVNTANGTRWFHGIISRFELTGHSPGQMQYRAELVPSIWLLTHRYNSRIFQAKTIVEIITTVLTDAGIPSDRFRLSGLEATYDAREYCVQYRETDYNFCCRLMEEAGIYWFFEQSEDGHVFVAADSKTYPAIEGDAALPYSPPTGLNVDTEHIYRFRIGQTVRPGAVVFNDFNFENPSLNLEARFDLARDTGLEFSDYPGEYTEQAAGTAIAKIRAEEFETGRTTGVGQSNSYRITSGATFDMTGHPSDDVNTTYLVTRVVHQGKQAIGSTTTSNGRGILQSSVYQSLIAAQQNDNPVIRELASALLQIATRIGAGDPTARRDLTHWLYHAGQVSKDITSVASALGGNPLDALSIPNLIEDMSRVQHVDFDAAVYECRFECIPGDVAYRPARLTPWPQIRGSQTARVVGPSGEEIHTDKYGRVKVQFNWDREGAFDENSSCWIRVSQGSAGGQYGMMFLPRVGHEVVVDFLEGDPDKPIIIGRVYNQDQMPVYALPDEKTKSYIKTNTSTGGGGTNEIRFEDLKDKEQILLYAQKDLHVRVNNDHVENVDNDHHLTVANNKFELVKKAKNSEVKLDRNEKVGGNLSLEVKGDVGEKFKGGHSEEAKDIFLKAKKKVVIEAGKGITLKVGGNFIKIDSKGITILGTKVKINSGGSADSGKAVPLTAPEKTVTADKAEPGKDVTYSGGGELAKGEVPADIAGYTPEPEEVVVEITWIEIELVDEEGGPVPYERYEITAPDGETVIKGELDRHGQAHRVVPGKPGETCQIAFPNLDIDAWERL